MVPDIIWLIFFFALGASIGSFLNVVIYRLPADLSLVSPGSHCPSCKMPIAWYDNIPILAWFFLRGRCRKCGTPFSFRYACIELLTALLFAGLYWCYFMAGIRANFPPFLQGGWVIYLGHIILIACLLSSSLIDAEHWIIPLSISYTITLCGMLLSMAGPIATGFTTYAEAWEFIPYATPVMAAGAFGAAAGLCFSIILVVKGVVPRSYAQLDEAQDEFADRHELKGAKADGSMNSPVTYENIDINDRKEMVWEMLFLAPVVILSLLAMFLYRNHPAFGQWWEGVLTGNSWLAGLGGSVFGFMVGGGVVWFTRIGGTIAFGREAMGLGDVHLMAGVGAMLGWFVPLTAFFVAPFMGLAWALLRLFIHKNREIPYGPFLSAATLIVIIAHDYIVTFFSSSLFNTYTVQ